MDECPFTLKQAYAGYKKITKKILFFDGPDDAAKVPPSRGLEPGENLDAFA
jgi:hypothetical protein